MSEFNDIERTKNVEEEFGVPTIPYFNRHFSQMIGEARINPGKAIEHSIKAEGALDVESISSDIDAREVRPMFRSARSKIISGMYEGLIYTSKRIAKKLKKEGFAVSINVRK